MKTRIKSRMITTCLLGLAIAAVVGIKFLARTSSTSKAAQKGPIQSGLIVHEWGTFTSIAGKDGIALEWRPLNGPTDLPDFVHTIQNRGDGLRHPAGKAELTAAVRMETPVLYFYSQDEANVSVKVDFPKGRITEWYPQARAVGASIDWGQIKIMPGAAVNLPAGYSASHYYAARETDAAPVQVCNTNGKPTQQEKFLFYRGVGTFDLPLSVRLDGTNIVLQNRGKSEISHLIIFENRGGKIGYLVVNSFTGEMTSERPALDKNMDTLVRDLKQILIASGLYEKEASAMIKTWRDSWFEEGTRVFYLLPGQTTDEVLPVTIKPRPAEMVRVLVGRAEVITAEMEKSVQKQVGMLSDASPKVRETAMQTIRKHGRFSEPILKRVLENEKNGFVRARLHELIESTPAKTP